MPRDPLPDANGEADELARQVDEWLAQNPDVHGVRQILAQQIPITIDDVRAAIDRHFGRCSRA